MSKNLEETESIKIVNTDISVVLSTDNVSVKSEQDIKDLAHYKDIIFDFDNDLEDQINAFMIWHEQPDDIILEITNKLCGMYLFSGSSMIKNLFINLIDLQSTETTKAPQDIIKIKFAKAICSYKSSEQHYEILNNTIKNLDNVPIVLMIDCVQMLMKSTSSIHRTDSLEYFIAIINNTEHDEDYRYRAILSIEHKLDSLDKDIVNYYMSETLYQFLNFPCNTCRYRILASQALLQKYYKSFDPDVDKNRRDSIQHSLSIIMNDQELDPDVRADAADVLLNLGDGIFVDNARDTIILLGTINGPIRSVYQDAQNTHNQEIESSALEILEHLDKVENNLTYEKAIVYVNNILKQHDDQDDDHDGNPYTEEIKDSVNIAMNRINIDRQLYSKYNISLKGILLRVITFINQSEHMKELQNRLIEELVDMHSKCSSGFAFRLINTLSGYCEHSIRISWADQISGNLLGRLNARIKAIESEEYRDNILVEMSMNENSTYDNRKNFMKFFRESLPHIHQEMWEIFKEDIDSTDFDLYMRRAIAKYEGCEFL